MRCEKDCNAICCSIEKHKQYEKGRADATKEIKSVIKDTFDVAYAKGKSDAIDEMKDKLQLSAIYTETENGWIGMTVDTIQIEEIAKQLKEQE